MNSSRPRHLIAALSLALPLAACGGGGGGQDPGQTPTTPKTEVVMSLGARTNLSGQITDSGGVTLPPLTLFAGDGSDIRVFLTFMTGDIRSEDVVSAALRIVPSEWRRDPTLAPINGFVAERVDVGASLDEFDWSATVLGPASPAGPAVIPGPTEGGAFQLDVTQSLKAHAATGAAFVTYRIRIAGVDDADGFVDAMGIRVQDPALPALNPLLQIRVLR